MLPPPTTVIIGDEDPFVRIADAETVARGVSGRPGDLVVVAGGGHTGLWRHASAWRATNRLLDRAMSGACEGARAASQPDTTTPR